MTCALLAARAERRREVEMIVLGAWRTATLTRAKRIPALAKLLRGRKRRTAEEQEEIRAEIAEAEAAFARMETQAGAAGGGQHQHGN